MTYGQIYHQNEVEQSRYNFDESDAAMHREHFDQFEAECLRLTGQGLLWPAYVQPVGRSGGYLHYGTHRLYRARAHVGLVRCASVCGAA